MAVVVVFLFALRHRDYASMRHFAYHVLELNRRMVNAEAMVQAVFHIAQDAFARRGRNIGNRDVAGKSARF
jgi:hypothetical protein